MTSNKKNAHGWKTINSKIDYQNPYMLIQKDLVRRPDGSENYFYTLEREGSFSIIIPVNNKQNAYLVGQYRYAAGYYSWEFPMGFVSNSSPLQMAKIELKQETGFSANKWKKIGDFFVANGHSSQKAYVYIARLLKKGKMEPEEGEFLQIKEVSFEQIDKMIKQGEILDGPTITAYYYFKQSKLKQNIFK